MSMSLTHSDVRRILEILDMCENLDSLNITVGEFELHARKPGAQGDHEHLEARRPGNAAPTASAVPPANVTDVAATSAATQQPSTAISEGLVAVRAPMLGTFYLRPSPDQPPFVVFGGKVQPDDVVCLVEVMKLFNTVKAGVCGTVEQILVGDGQPVKHDEVLMLIRPQAIN